VQKMAHHMFFVTDKSGNAFSHERCSEVRESLKPVLGNHGGEAIVKMINSAQSFRDGLDSWLPEDSVKSATDVWEVSFDGASEGSLQTAVTAFKTVGVSVTFSRVRRDEKDRIIAQFYIEKLGEGEAITPLEAQQIRDKISSGGDIESGSQVTVRPLVGKPRTRSLADAADNPHLLAQLAVAAERPETPVEPIKSGETTDALQPARATSSVRVAPAPEGVEAEA